jgi:hypothetical protein
LVLQALIHLVLATFTILPTTVLHLLKAIMDATLVKQEQRKRVVHFMCIQLQYNKGEVGVFDIFEKWMKPTSIFCEKTTTRFANMHVLDIQTPTLTTGYRVIIRGRP